MSSTGEELVSPEIVSILVLVVIFVIATMLPVNMGVLAFAAAVLVGGLISFWCEIGGEGLGMASFVLRVGRSPVLPLTG
jgi:hypothetical protein